MKTTTILFAALAFASSGHSHAAEAEEPQLLRLRAGVVDPSDMAKQSVASGPNAYAVVQFERERSTEMMRDLRARGVRFHGYLPDGAWIIRFDALARELVSSSDATTWIGPYLDVWKVSPLLRKESRHEWSEIVVIPFRGESMEKLIAGIGRLGGVVTEVIWEEPLPRAHVLLSPDDDLIEQIAAISQVSWIEPHFELRTENVSASPIIQNNITSDEGRTLFEAGLTGTGQIIAIADTGADVDSCFFTQLNGVNAITEATRTDQPALGPLFPDRKIIGYWVQRNADPYDDNETCPGGTATGFHGTHVAGSAVGDNAATPSSPSDPGVDPGDGMAPNAQLLFQDVGAANGCLNGTSDLYNTFLQAYEAGARTHSDSYGGDSRGSYSTSDLITDRFLFRFEQMSIFTSAGNQGPGLTTTSSPANAKNIISVGANNANGQRTGAAGFSSRGPTEDGRVKPDLTAPGSSIRSASGTASETDGNCATRSLSGTSMAAPIAAGGSALVRQYFMEGRYPSGAPNPTDSLDLTAPAMKAILLNGTRPLPESGQFGGNVFGWGRIWLDNNLYLPGDSREMRIWPVLNAAGLSEGEVRQFRVDVTDPSEELRVTLVWSDPPASLSSAVALVNDLDLTVTNGSDLWIGNHFDATGNSIPGGEADRLNNVEQIRIPNPGVGEWTIEVRASSIPGNGEFLTDQQGFALVASHATCSTAVVGAPSRLSSSNNPVIGIDLRWEPAAGSTVDQVYRAPADDPLNFQYIGSSTNGFFNDNRAQRGETFLYRIRSADGCGEGPPSAAVTATSSTGCDLEPDFAGAVSAESASPNCAIVLRWDEATQRCNEAGSIRYNVYRSDDPTYVPQVGEVPYAVVDDQTTFVDNAVESGVRYFYLVRAEDTSSAGDGPSGGAEDENLSRVSSVTSGPPTGTGTWTDDAGDTSSLLNGESPWHITEESAHESQFAYFAGVEGGSYPNLTCASLETPSLDLRDGSVLSYWASYDLEVGWDGVIVEISEDGGSTWIDLPPDAGYPSDLNQTGLPPVNECGYPPSQGAFNGPVGFGVTDWAEYTSDLSQYANRSVKIRWRFTTDPGDEQTGFYLDDIAVTNVGVPGDCLPLALIPEAEFLYKPRSPLAGSPVFFEDTSAFRPTSWSWDFGDGTSSTEENPEHIYLAPGVYTVVLTVSNGAGESTVDETIQVFDNQLTYEIEGVVPGQARAEGAAGSFFKTSFWATNTASSSTTMRLRYLSTPSSVDGGAAIAVIYEIEPGRMIAFQDVLTEAFGASSNTAGAIVVEVPTGFPVPIVTSRTYNEPNQFIGTSGQYIPAVPVEGNDGSGAVIQGLGGNSSFRSNVGVVNLGDITIQATLTVLDPDTESPLGNPVVIDVPPYSSVQVNAVNGRAGLGELDLFGVRVTGTGDLFAYASKLDNVTSDPTYIPSTLQPRTLQWTDGVGAIPGAGGTFFRSNLSLSNPGGSAASVTIFYTPRGSTSPAAQTVVQVSPGETLFFEDAVSALFPEIGGVGMFRYESTTPVVAWVRTFNDRDLSGTYGQFIPAFGTEDLIPGSGAILQGLSENPDFRTNAGIVNVGPGDQSMTIRVFDRDASLLGEKTYGVREGEAIAISRVMADIVPGISIADGYLSVLPSSGATMYVWTSSVDNRSTDQTFVRPIPITP